MITIASTIIGIFFLLLIKSSYIIPQRTVVIIERLGKYSRTLDAGFHIIIPIIDRVAYKHSLKEKAIDVPVQICITKDNIAVEVDAVLYLQVVDPYKAAYGIVDYLFATTQISQTTMRSVIGKLDLDSTFKERDNINGQIVQEVDKASDPWGIKVNRYEIKDIKPPKTINDAMEKQMRAEREKRAVIAQSEGERQACINRAEGEKLKRIQEAEGRSQEIYQISKATAEGLLEVAKSIQTNGGKEAVSMRIAEQYIKEFGNLAKANNTMIIPQNLSDLSSMIATATSIYKNADSKDVVSKMVKQKKEPAIKQ